MLSRSLGLSGVFVERSEGVIIRYVFVRHTSVRLAW